MDLLLEGAVSFGSVISDPKFAWGMLASIAVGLAVYFWSEGGPERRRRHEKAMEGLMTSYARMKEINSLIADQLTHAVQGSIDDGLLSVDEGIELFRRFGNVLSIEDLMPRGQLTLKCQLTRHKLMRALEQQRRDRAQAEITALRDKYNASKKENANPFDAAIKA